MENELIRQFDNSTMEEWKDGRMNELIRQFDNGRMEEWKNGK
jgi:hypothetical protein